MNDDWKGQNLIRIAPRRIDPLDAPIDDPSERVVAVRNAALSGLSRVDTANLLGMPYNSVVWISQRHKIPFPDTRRLRAREGRRA